MNTRVKNKLRTCSRDCSVRVTMAMAALTPMSDQAMSVFPLLREHIPANMYAIGFFIIVLFNILTKFRAPAIENESIAEEAK